MINPYQSFLVRASAGTGKTFQLSRRFLHLVGAWADANEILTVTFTNKAAAEMRERILREAARLIYDPAAAESYEKEALTFWQQDGQNYRKPRTARETGHAILDKTQLLTITTIDALFYEWMLKLPLENHNGRDLLDPLTHKEIYHQAFEGLCVYLFRQGGLPEELAGHNLENVRTRLAELERYRTLQWLNLQTQGHTGLIDWPTPELMSSTEELLASLETDLLCIAQEVSNTVKRDQIVSAIHARDLDALMSLQFINKAYGISGTLIRGKKREALAAPVGVVDRALLQHINNQRKQGLNQTGHALMNLSLTLVNIATALKQQRGYVDFDDLAKGAYDLMHGQQSAGIRYLLAQGTKHFLVDEFQDTSRLQWQIFEPLVEELTAGQGLSETCPQTVFFVGDEKQSIYGFREADPTVMSHAGQTLSGRLHETSMAASYRTAQGVLDFVNATFVKAHMEDFPAHSTANVNETPFVLNYGATGVLPLTEGNDERSAAEAEAEAIASLVEDALKRSQEFKVFERDTRTFRPLRPGDCAVLYRSQTHADLYEGALRERHLPCMRAEEKGFFERPEIRDLTYLLRWLAAPDDLTSLVSVLRGALFEGEEARLFATLYETKHLPLGQREEALLSKLHPNEADALKSLAKQARAGVPPLVLVTQALETLDVVRRLGVAFGDNEATKTLVTSNCGRFIELIIALEKETTGDLLSTVRKLLALADLDDIGNAPVTADAINLMTIHKSKGLEFPLVIIADTGRPFGSKDRYWLKLQGKPHTNLVYMGSREEKPLNDDFCTQIEESFAQETAAESERLLYVAMTRAKHYLFVTGHKPQRTQGFEETTYHSRLEHALSSLGAEAETWCNMPAKVIWHRNDLGMKPAEATPPEKQVVLEKEWTQEPLLQATRLTPATQTLAKGLFVDPSPPALLPPPLPMGADTYGDLVHKEIEQALRTGRPCQGERAVMDEAEGALAAIRSLAADALQIYPEQPCQILLVGSSDKKPAQVLTGVIDLVVVKEKEIWVIDYKTSRLKQPTEKNLRRFAQMRGYDQQVALYQKAVRASFPGKEIKGALLFTASGVLLPV